MTSKCFSLLLSASSLTLLSLYWSVSGMFGSCRSSRLMVYDWYELTSSSLTFCSIVLLVSLTLSMIRCAASSRLASSTSAYTQSMSFSFLRASLSAQMSMRLCQTTLFVFDFELTMINRFGSPVAAPSVFSFTSSNVFTVFSSGRGKKNIVPLQAFNELWLGTFPVYVPSL